MFRIVPVILMSAILAQAGAPRAIAGNPPPIDAGGTLAYRALDNPKTGDEFMFRLAEQQRARARSDAMFAALSALLGGAAPGLNFVPTGSSLLTRLGHMSANTQDFPGAPAGTINIDPLATASLIQDNTTAHGVTVNGLPHEMAHLRQLSEILSNVPDREGGAQSFADIVAQEAARRAGIPYTPDNYDGAYAEYVKAVNAQRGRDWILAGQFGRSGSPVWP